MTAQGNALGVRNYTNYSPVRAKEVIFNIDLSAPLQGFGSL